MKERYFNMNNKNSIFDNVQFMNEGILAAVGGFLLTLPILAGATVIACATISNKMNKAKEKTYKKKLNKALTDFAKNDSEVGEFNEKAENVKGIALTILSEKIKMDNKSIDICKKNNAGCYAITDKEDNIMAYAIFDFTNNKYSYKILEGDRNNKNLNDFVAASFELHTNLLGDACKKFIDLNFHKTLDSDRHDITATDEEFEFVMNNMSKLAKYLREKLNSIAKSISNDDFDNDYKPGISKSFNSNNGTEIEYVLYIDMRDEKEYYDGEDFKEDLYTKDKSKVLSKLVDSLKSEGFETKQDDGLMAKNSDKYPGFNIYFNDNPDDTAFVVEIVYNKRLKK